jgi:hypothetical protein
MLSKILALAALTALAGPVQAATINGTFSAALAEVDSNTFGIQAGSIFTNGAGAVTSATEEFEPITTLTPIAFSTVTATNGTPVSFSSSFGNFVGSIINVATIPSPNARVGLNIFGNFTPIGTLSAFSAGPADLTLSFTQTGDLSPNSPQPSISGSFTFSSPSMIAAVPEPASWAMLITGFGMTGAVLRRRKAAVTA